MRTITVYNINELSEAAKSRAIESLRDQLDEYYGGDDALASLIGFARHFGAEVEKYQIDWTNSTAPSWVKFDAPELTAKELGRKIRSMGSYNKQTMKGLGDCKFTGYCMDDDAADGARIAYFSGERNIDAILQAGFRTWVQSVWDDCEAQGSDEYLAEFADVNGYEFDEDGNIN